MLEGDVPVLIALPMPSKVDVKADGFVSSDDGWFKLSDLAPSVVLVAFIVRFKVDDDVTVFNLSPVCLFWSNKGGRSWQDVVTGTSSS